MWTLLSVIKVGNDEGVEVTLINDEDTLVFTWSRDADQSVSEFAQMVKTEIDAHLLVLSTPLVREDVTAIYKQYLND